MSAHIQASEQQVKMAAELYKMRDRAKTLLGERYKPHMAELGRILMMNRDNKSPLEVAIEVCKERNLIDMDLMMVMSAAVELLEPTP